MRRAEDEAALRAATVDERGKTGVGFFFPRHVVLSPWLR